MNLTLDSKTATRFARLALDCVHREYPNKIAHVLSSDADVRPPRELTPAFYGCFDWHSAVHAHWLLARLARLFPKEAFAAEARAALARSITRDNIAVEFRYLQAEGRRAFERPYGLAWLLALGAELRLSDVKLAATLLPLELTAATRLQNWLEKLPCPDRSGQHSNTAFAMGLALDSAFPRLIEVIQRRARDYYLADRDAPVSYEPSGEDFLSPCLAEADLMRRVLPPEEFSAVAGGVPAGSSASAACGFRRPKRWKARARRWIEFEPSLDARGNLASASRLGRYSRVARRRRSGRDHERTLRRRSLAGDIRSISAHSSKLMDLPRLSAP